MTLDPKNIDPEQARLFKPNYIRASIHLHADDAIAKVYALEGDWLELKLLGPHPTVSDQFGPWRIKIETLNEGTWTLPITEQLARAIFQFIHTPIEQEPQQEQDT